MTSGPPSRQRGEGGAKGQKTVRSPSSPPFYLQTPSSLTRSWSHFSRLPDSQLVVVKTLQLSSFRRYLFFFTFHVGSSSLFSGRSRFLPLQFLRSPTQQFRSGASLSYSFTPDKVRQCQSPFVLRWTCSPLLLWMVNKQGPEQRRKYKTYFEVNRFLLEDLTSTPDLVP